MADENRDQTILRLRYSRTQATWIFALCGAVVFSACGMVLLRAPVIGGLLGVSLRLIVSRLYIAVVDGLLAILEQKS